MANREAALPSGRGVVIAWWAQGRRRALERQQVEELRAAVQIVDENIQNLAAATRRLNALLAVAMPWADELLCRRHGCQGFVAVIQMS